MIVTVNVAPVADSSILLGYGIGGADLPDGGKVELVASGKYVRVYIKDGDGKSVGAEWGYEFDITPAVEAAVDLALEN